MSSIPNNNTTPVELIPDFQFDLSIDCVIIGYDEDAVKLLLIERVQPSYSGQLSVQGGLLMP